VNEEHLRFCASAEWPPPRGRPRRPGGGGGPGQRPLPVRGHRSWL